MKTYELDIRSNTILDNVFPPLKAKMLSIYYGMYEEFGVKMRPTRGLSTMEEQLKLWQKGRDADGNVVSIHDVVTNAPPGSSYHCYGLAVDSCFWGQDPYLEYLEKKRPGEALELWIAYGAYASRASLVWGGNFHKLIDRPHVQMDMSITLRALQDVYKKERIEGVYRFANHVYGVINK